MKQPFEAWMIQADNQMEAFMEDKRKTTRIVQPDELPEGHYWAPVPIAAPAKKPWKLKFLIFAGLLGFVWYQVAKQLGWLN